MKACNVVAVFFTLILSFSNCFAQEMVQMEEFSYGTVKSVSGQELVVTEYDYENDEEIDVTYLCDEKTEFKNVSLLTDVMVGDNADIVFVPKDSQKVIQSLTIEKPALDEESPVEEPVLVPTINNEQAPQG